MTDLSPAAQAVLDAWDAKLEPMVTCLTHDPEREALAAALRAAADQIESLYCDGDVEDSPGIVFALRQLMLIANELETQ
jgi:hypothetical protein